MPKPPRHLSGCSIKLDRAAELIGELHTYVQQYFTATPPSHSASVVGGVPHFVAAAKLPPEKFSAIVGDALHNARSALDIMAVDVVKHVGGNPKGVRFPVCKDPTGLDKAIKSAEFHRAGADAVDLLKSMKPFDAGNVALKALHDLDVADKHNAVIEQYASVTSPEFVAQVENGILIGLTPKPGSMTTVELIFKPGGPLGGEEVFAALNRLLAEATRIVEQFAKLKGLPYPPI